MKALIFFPHPTKGGIERNLSIWLTCLKRNADPSVEVELFGKPTENSPVHDAGRWIKGRGRLDLVGEYIAHLRRSRPDVVVCFQLGVIGLIARFLGIPVIVRLNNDPSHATLDPSVRRRLSEIGKRATYRFADRLVANSEELAERVSQYGAPVSVVRTPVPSVTPSATHEPNFLFVGRLAPQKNVLALVAAFADVVTLCPTARLEIVGDGEQYAAIEQHIRDRGLEEVVHLEGWRSPPKYEGSRYFVLPSLYEGSPNALVEAAASGLYPVLSPFTSGGCEIVRMLGYGTIASGFDVDSLARAMREALTSDWTFRADASGFQRFIHAYSVDNACKNIKLMMNEVVRRPMQ